jgi:arylsulfatase A-like enzyme
MKIPGNSSHEIVRALAFAYDLVPTFLDYANVTYPKTFKGINLEQLAGKSLLPIIEKKMDRVHPENETIPLEYFGVEAVYKGNLKAINLPKEFGGDSQWHLYDLSVDPQESKDLSKEQPAVMQELIAAYDQFAN